MAGSMKKGFMLVMSAVIMMIVVVSAEATETSASFSVDVLSNYVWRGQNLGDDGVVQPSLDVTSGNFGINYWSNQDMETNEGNETDLTLSYSTEIDKLSLGFGYIYYALDGAEDTQEVYVSASYDMFMSPSITLYGDFDEGDGAFIVASIGHSIGINDKASLNLGASASANIDNKVMGTDSSGKEFTDFYNGEVSASVSYAVNDKISIEPKVAYSFPLSSDAKNVFEGLDPKAHDDVFYGGVNLTLSF